MSYNPYLTTPEVQEEIRRIARSEYANQKTGTSVWFHPIEEAYYAALNPASQEPDYGVRLTKPHAFKGLSARPTYSARQQLQGGSAAMSKTEVDNMRFHPFTNEAETDAVNFYDKIDRARKEYEQTRDMGRFLGAGTITTSSYPAIANVMIDRTVLDLVNRQFVIMDVVTRIPWDKLVYTFDNRTPFLNTGGLGELDSAASGNISYARGTITLKKAQGRVSASIWAGLAVRDHDIVGDNESIVSADFERIFVEELATTIAGFGDQATGGAYDVIAAGSFHSTTNPGVRFIADTGTIRAAGGNADVALMNTLDFMALTQNTHMRDGGSLFGAVSQPAGRTESRLTSHRLWPGVTIAIDEKATTDQISLFDRRAVAFIEGPTNSRVVMTSDDQVRDTVNDRWYGSGRKVSTWGVDETNIHT